MRYVEASTIVFAAVGVGIVLAAIITEMIEHEIGGHRDVRPGPDVAGMVTVGLGLGYVLAIVIVELTHP